MKQKFTKIAAIGTNLMFGAQMALAAGGESFPWESRLESLLDSISGPVAQALGAMAIIVTGIMLAFGEGGGGARRMLWVVFGLSIAFSATSFFLSFLGFAGGVTF